MSDANHPIAIVVAVIGVLGTLGAALIGNWETLFPPSSGPLSETRFPEATGIGASPSAGRPPNIAGLWRDRDDPRNRSQVIQEGDTFRFTRWGVLPNGVEFSSSGSGTINGRQLASRYDTRYHSGTTSAGECWGMVSANGARLELTCRDSLFGTFPLVADRP